MAKLQEKQNEFLLALNDRLPRGVVAHCSPSKNWPEHTVNIILSMSGNLVGLFVLEQGEFEVNWWVNNSGGLY
jgi:hypothetical protein